MGGSTTNQRAGRGTNICICKSITNIIPYVLSDDNLMDTCLNNRLWISVSIPIGIYQGYENGGSSVVITSRSLVNRAGSRKINQVSDTFVLSGSIKKRDQHSTD